MVCVSTHIELHCISTADRELPRNSAVRKINELVKRCRLAKVHAYIIGHLRAQMPQMMGKEKVQKKLIADMAGVFRSVMKQHNLAPGDFPDLEVSGVLVLARHGRCFGGLRPSWS